MAAGITMIHVQLSIALRQPEIELDERESMMLAQAAANVSRWYVAVDLNADTKMTNWLALFVTLLMVYGPRAMAIARRKGELAATATPEPEESTTIQ